MKARLTVVAIFAALLCCAAQVFAQAEYQTDITLEGPWILYEDHQFLVDDGSKTTTTVLIAVAPTAAHMMGTKKNAFLHQPPQLSTGDGYPIKLAGIYCLTFVDSSTEKCAPTALPPGSNNYPPHQLLKITYLHPTPNWRWEWWSAAKGQIALILPKPDSISNDGVWHMRFGQKFDKYGRGYGNEGKHSIGVQLHYAHGPAGFNLYSCDSSLVPSVASCKTRPTKPMDTYLDNSGTLRIQMKAPDSNDGCDIHVRYAYREMFKLLNAGFDQQFAVIEPAYGGPQGTPQYENAKIHPCFNRDPQRKTPTNLGGSLPEPTTPALKDSCLSLETLRTVSSLGTQLTNIAECLSATLQIIGKDPRYKDINSLKKSTQAAQAAQAVAIGLDPNFPRMSQSSRVWSLIQLSEGSTARFERANKLTGKVRDDLDKTRAVQERDIKSVPTKSGGDCRAAFILVTSATGP